MKIIDFFKNREKKIKSISIVTILVIFIYFIIQLFLLGSDWFIWDTKGFLTVKKFVNIFFLIYIFLIAVVIFLESKDPSSTLAWLVVLILMPFVGFIFYILFGRTIRKKFKSFSFNNNENIMLQNELLDYLTISDSTEQEYLDRHLIKLFINNAQAPFSENNKIEVLENGTRTYYKMIKDLKSAEKFIHFEFFIIKDDDIGNKFKNVLIDKAKEGLEVRVIYDSVGCWKLPKKYISQLKKAGVEVYSFSPVLFPLLSRDFNYRNHRKIITIDGKTGYIGGLNIGDEYLGKNKYLGFWRDTHLKIQGQSVLSIQNIFLKDWYHVSNEKIDDDKYFPKIEKDYGDSLIQIVSSGPDSKWQCIMKGYFTMITKANKRIWINTPYLVPDPSLRTGLISAALSGVDVRIIIPNKPDHFLVYWSSRDNIEQLLRAGVKVYTYEKGFIHSKSILVDSTVATVGTANFDYRSLEINYEINAFIYDKKVVKTLEENYLKDLKDSKEIKLKQHLKRPIYEKFLEAFGRLVSPLQ